jgi:hypothetical protein
VAPLKSSLRGYAGAGRRLDEGFDQLDAWRPMSDTWIKARRPCQGSLAPRWLASLRLK